LAKLPLVICSESIYTISLSKATKVVEKSTQYSTTFVSKYANRSDHLDKSLHQYFHIIKNDSDKKEFIPHYVGGGGQPTYPISINFESTELIKHVPWHKQNPLPIITETNYIKLFKHFHNSQYCPTSVSISVKRAQNRIERLKRGIKEPISEEITESQPLEENVNEDVKIILQATTNINEMSNIFDKLEQQGLDIGKNYNWNKKIYKVNTFLCMHLVHHIYTYTQFVYNKT
jgi:hypothetical protein